MTGYGITMRSFSLFTLSGTWMLNTTGQVLGYNTEDIGGESVSGSFIGKVVSGKQITASVTAQNGKFTITGIPSASVPVNNSRLERALLGNIISI